YEAQLTAAPAALVALEGVPLALPTLRRTLPKNSALVQIFAPTRDTWHWFVLDSERLAHVETAPQSPSQWPEAVLHLLDGKTTLLVDAGELPPLPPIEGILQTSVLSATYWAV